VHGSSGTTAGDGIWTGTSSVVSALAKEEDGSSSEGTAISSGGASGENNGCTGAEGAAGATGKDSSSLSCETGGPRWLDTTTEGGRGKHSDNLTFVGRSSKLGTTEFLHKTPGRVGGDDDVAVTGT